MPKTNNSKCQLVQLYIDAYLDDELEPARLSEFKGHLTHCTNCSAELAYAEYLHQSVVSLPLLNCSDNSLEPIDRLFESSATGSQNKSTSMGSKTLGFLSGLPGMVRFGVPAMAVVILAIGFVTEFAAPPSGVELANQNPQLIESTPQYSQEEIVQALKELEIAIGYLSEVSQRTNVMIEDRFLVRKLQETLSATLNNDEVEETTGELSNGPI